MGVIGGVRIRNKYSRRGQCHPCTYRDLTALSRGCVFTRQCNQSRRYPSAHRRTDRPVADRPPWRGCLAGNSSAVLFPSSKEKEKERQARAEVSMREREKEVQRTLATHMRDRDKEREQHKRDEAIQHFNALLADLVRSAELGWREVKRILRKDQRWDLADTLSRDEKEKLFSDHIETIVRKKREKFRELLDETQEVSLTSTWKEIKKVIKEDPRYTKFASSERVSNNLTFTLYFYVNH